MTDQRTDLERELDQQLDAARAGTDAREVSADASEYVPGMLDLRITSRTSAGSTSQVVPLTRVEAQRVVDELTLALELGGRLP